MQEISLYTYWSHSCCLSVIVFNFTVFPQFSIILCGHGICVILWKLTIIHCDSLWVKLPKTSVFHTRTFCRTPCYSLWGSNIRKDERSKTWCNHLHVMKQATEKSEKKKSRKENGVRESRDKSKCLSHCNSSLFLSFKCKRWLAKISFS